MRIVKETNHYDNATDFVVSKKQTEEEYTELTVTISLHEYRELVEYKAKAEYKMSEEIHKRAILEGENKRLKEKIEKLICNDEESEEE